MAESAREKPGETEVRAGLVRTVLPAWVSLREDTGRGCIIPAKDSEANIPPGGRFYFPIQSLLGILQEPLKNINRVLTHLCLKALPLSLGGFLHIFTRLQRGQPAPEINQNPCVRAEGEVCLLKKMTDFQSNLSLGIAS